MAITKVTRELLSTGIDDNSNATAITIDSSERASFSASKMHIGSGHADAYLYGGAEGDEYGGSSNNSASWIRFSDNTSNNAIMHNCGHASGGHRWEVAGTEYFRIAAGQIDVKSADLKMQDSRSLYFGTGNDLRIYHDGSDSYIKDQGTGNLLIQASDIYFGDASGNHTGRFNMSSGLLSIGDTGQNSGDLESTKRLYLEGAESVAMIKNTSSTSSANRVSIGFLDSGGTRRGYIYTNNSTADMVTTSDYRQKENVTPMVNGLSRVNALKPVKFKWKHDDYFTEGFLAHEVQEAGWNEGVTGEKDGEEMQAVSYGRITPLLVKAIQEQQTIIDDLKLRIKTLEDA